MWLLCACAERSLKPTHPLVRSCPPLTSGNPALPRPRTRAPTCAASLTVWCGACARKEATQKAAASLSAAACMHATSREASAATLWGAAPVRALLRACDTASFESSSGMLLSSCVRHTTPSRLSLAPSMHRCSCSVYRRYTRCRLAQCTRTELALEMSSACRTRDWGKRDSIAASQNTPPAASRALRTHCSYVDATCSGGRVPSCSSTTCCCSRSSARHSVALSDVIRNSARHVTCPAECLASHTTLSASPPSLSVQ
mmetsp:Transcript_45392/g.110526  ORF Transcript_45392/g.110526 Transcript_45392/m.110526 type:complete len:257 (-) Transcript_45392:59-829(-)